MKNTFFDITIDKETSFVSSIVNLSDEYNMNWCADDGTWGKLHGEAFSLVFNQSDDSISKAVFENGKLSVTVTRFYKEKGNYVENYKLKNITSTVLTVTRDNFGIETPFNDRYTNADECLVRRCNTHIWCGHNVAWVNALKMGDYGCNLGLFVTKGAIDCYSQNSCKTNSRGIFVLHPQNFMLKSGEEYELEWELFWHKGNEDFFEKIREYENYIEIDAEHYTVFDNEPICFCFTVSENKGIEVCCNNKPVSYVFDGGRYCVEYTPERRGEHRFIIKNGEVSTYAEFMVEMPFDQLLEKRVNFIVEHQQCLDKESPLYGAYLVYDNETDTQYFDFYNPDHNACRERLNIPLLLIKYLQKNNNSKVRASIDLFIEFLFREFYEETTGEVFNNIGKSRDQLRLYNAPGVMLVFCEMYFLTGEKNYLKHIVKLAENYYSIGGKKCYSNAVAVEKVMAAFKKAGMAEEYNVMFNFFKSHAENIMSNGVSYPIHEVDYEQTIVTPAVMITSEFGIISGEKEKYISEAGKHLKCLERFSGHQPSYHLNEIAIRFWDDFWFGKSRMFGDTLPHHLSVLTARAYISYVKLSGDSVWLKRAENILRNCLCLVNEEGRGSAAYVYPYKLNGLRGEFYDAWSNDQDLVLYDMLYYMDYMMYTG